MKRSSLKLNTFYNAGSAIVPIVMSIVTTPFLLHSLGSARFGIISLIWLLFNYFGIFDLGLSQATSNRLSKKENAEPGRQAEIALSALFVNGGFGLLGGTLFYFCAGPIFNRMASIPPDILSELHVSIIWFACLVPLSTVNAVFVGVMESHERFGELSLWQSIGSISGQALPLLAIVLFGPTLGVALGATVLSRVLCMLPVAALAFSQLRWIFVRPSLPVIKDLLSFGSWITLTNLVSPILVSADQFLIGALLGVAAVPNYSIPFTLASKASILPGAYLRAMFPRFSRASRIEAAALAASSLKLLSWGLVAICIPAIFAIEWVLHLWLGARFSEQASEVGKVLLLGVWANALAAVPFYLLQSQGRPDVAAKFHWLELVPFVALLWGFIHQFGLIGAAMAWTVRVTVDGLLLLWASDIPRAACLKLVPPAAALLAALALSQFTPASALPSLAWALGSAAVLGLLAFKAEPVVADAVRSVLRRRTGTSPG